MTSEKTFEELKYRIERTGRGIFYYDQNGEFHREDGPAVIWLAGGEAWFKHGLRHRINGPAIDYPDDRNNSCRIQEWWVDGEHVKCRD